MLQINLIGLLVIQTAAGSLPQFQKFLGIFGIEEASQQLFGLPASQLSLSEASLLAAVLPNPKQRSVKNPSLFVQRRALAISDGASTILKDERSQCFTD